MISKFTYYDIISNFIPGLTLIWGLFVLGPFSKDTIPILLTGNTIIDPLLVLAISYVIGHALQFLSRYTIEPILKIVFWKGHFFSDIFLISDYKLCSSLEFNKYVICAENKLGFIHDELAILSDARATSNKETKDKAIELCKAIYRKIDAKTQDSSQAQKAHLQNTFYGFFRNLSVVFLILALMDIFDLIKLVLGIISTTKITISMIFLNMILCIIFILQAKRRGELYVRGLFWSYV